MEKMVREFARVCDRISSCGGCDISMTGKTKLGWVKFR